MQAFCSDESFFWLAVGAVASYFISNNLVLG